jgi:hypothetical protein
MGKYLAQISSGVQRGDNYGQIRTVKYMVKLLENHHFAVCENPVMSELQNNVTGKKAPFVR